jgi:hypothetical protein
MKKWKKTLKKWGLFALGCVSLLAWGIATGWWGPTFLCIYFLGSFIMWARRQTVPIQSLIVLLMLPAIDAKIKALEEWNRDAERHVIAEAKQFEQYILRSNTEEQLYRRGQDSEGFELMPSYTPFTVQIKRSKGQPTDRVTLLDTGQFHASFYVIWQDTEFEIYAKDVLTPKLAGKYGPEIFGLDDNSQQDLIDNLRQPLKDNLKKAVAA